MTEFLKRLKDWWWLVIFLVGAIVLWGNLPKRVDKIEAGQAKQDDAIVDLKGIASRLDGYIQGQQETNQLLKQQQTPNQVYRPQAPQPVPQPIPSGPTPPTTLRVQWEQDEYQQWFCRRSDGAWWWPNEQGDCE